MKKVDILVVGAGIFGLTIAERVANELGKKVLVIDKRNHIGGNSYSEIDTETGIECHKYGAHIFHTSNTVVWKYVNRFSKFTNYQHRVYSVHNNEVFSLPINLGTINQFFRASFTPDEAKKLIANQAKDAPRSPKNLKEQGIKLIGQPLFEAFIMNYTAKQWQTSAEELSSDIIKRLPVRYNYNNRYFSDVYEGLPENGYGRLFKTMLDSGGEKITLRLGTDYLDDNELREFTSGGGLTIFTGPIDQFFDYKYGELSWRSVMFKKETLPIHDFQGCSVMNYADLEEPFTRIIEFKHFHPERTSNGYSKDSRKTVIYKEFSKEWKKGEEPYYPVGTRDDQEKLKKYQQLAKQYPNLVFGGRLGEYAYYDMDVTFLSALTMFKNIVTDWYKKHEN